MKSLGKVLDISKFQGKLTQDAVTKIKKQGILGVILRIGVTGYGGEQPTMDSCFEYNYALLHDNGIPCGAYYFTIAYNNTIADREIEFLKRELGKKKFELPIYIDVEAQTGSKGWTNLSASARTTYVAKICKALEQERYYVGIYASKSWFGSKLLEAPLKAFDKWIAQYFVKCTYGGTYHLWQYTSSGNGALYGISGRVDVSECFLDFPSIIKREGLNGYGLRKDAYTYNLTLSESEKVSLENYLSSNSIEFSAKKV